MVAAGEAGHIAGVADDGGGDDGPAPNSPVRLVPVAWTAAASFFLVSRIRASMPRRSSRNAAASSQRAAATAPDRVTESRIRVA